MIYPSISQYIESIKEAEDNFATLTNLRPVLGKEENPIMSSGNLAVVFKMKDVETGKFYAVKCSLKDQPNRAESYRLISEELEDVTSTTTCLTKFEYLDKELFVDTNNSDEDEFPVLLMDWVEGVTLGQYLRKHINNKQSLQSLVNQFKKLAIWLLSQSFAHGDIKPDNIIVRDNGTLVLVDYDGMFVHAMEGQRARELGSPDFRNPSRSESDFGKDIDTFPLTSIIISLELLREDNNYLSKYGAEDRLLFSEEDYRNIDNSIIYKIALASYNEEICNLAELLKDQIIGNGTNYNTLKHIINGDNWRKEINANEKIEKPLNIILAIYSILLFLTPFIMRSAGWSLLSISLVMLFSNLFIYMILNIADLLRPSKKYHIGVGVDGNSGCIGVIALFIPVLLMSDFFSDELLSFLGLPNYDGKWYNTLLIWIIWYCNLLLCGATMDNPYELRYRYYKTKEEKENEDKEKEKNRLRKELFEKNILSN